LLFRHWGIHTFCKIEEIINAVENGVDSLGNVVMHVVQFHFFGFDLLRSDFAIDIEQM
jgi:hypothetical protein